LTIVVYRIGFAKARSVAEQAYGSTLFDGRWHSLRAGPRPRRVIYAASSRALAQLEKRVHANGVAPINQALFALTLPEDVAIAHAHERGLPAHWRDDLSASQAFGNDWLDQGQDLALWVPSFVEPAEDNLLIHPEHPRIVEVGMRVEREPFEFDPRLS
jgi:RES domain-containing protein